MHVYPTNLERTGDRHLLIHWSDDTKRLYSFRELRAACPCATCREQRNKPEQAAPLLNVLKPEETRPLTITGMKPVGSYAYSIAFSDGHDTGIFSFELLQSLGKETS